MLRKKLAGAAAAYPPGAAAAYPPCTRNPKTSHPAIANLPVQLAWLALVHTKQSARMHMISYEAKNANFIRAETTDRPESMF